MNNNKIIDVFQIKTLSKTMKDDLFANTKKIEAKKFDDVKFIYDYINHPEIITIVKNDVEKEEKYFLALNNSDLKYPIYDNFGQKLNIQLSSDIIKLKAEYRLYKELINKYEQNEKLDIALNYKMNFLAKWYKLEI